MKMPENSKPRLRVAASGNTTFPIRRDADRSWARVFALVFAVLAALPAAAEAQDAIELKWSRLAPPPPVSSRTFLPKPGMVPQGQTSIPGHTSTDGAWMSGVAKVDTTAPPELAKELAGQRVRIGGYVVPLDFNATRVTEFLLVPFVGACVHVPPPPANQIIYVKFPKGLQIGGLFDPVYVTGPLTLDFTSTGLADAGYSIAAERIDARPKS